MGVPLLVEGHDRVVAGQPLRALRLLASLCTDAPWRSRRRDGSLRLGWDAVVHHAIDGNCSLTQRRATPPVNSFEQVASIGEQMESVGNLESVGCAVAGTIRVGTGTIATDHVDAGVLTRPRRQTLGGSVRQ